MNNSGYNMEIVKKKNRASVLKLINSRGPMSRKDIAAELGLTSAAVTLICNEIIAEGLLTEKGIKEEARAGRKKILLDVNSTYRYVIGINIDAIQITVALTDLRGTLINERRMAVDVKLSATELLEKAADECKRLLSSSRDQAKEATGGGISMDKIAGIGVGVPGLVDRENGVSLLAYGLWTEPVRVADILQERLHLPVRIENNVSAFARAEQLYGVGREKDNLMFLKWGPGVGGAIITANHLYDGRHGKAAELGHIIIDKKGEKCACGRRGCLETRVSFKAVKKQLEVLFSKEETPELYQALDGDIEGFTEDRLGLLVKSSDARVRLLFDEIIDIFAGAIVNAVTLIAPNRVMLYGRMFSDERVRERFIEMCKSYDTRYNEAMILYSMLAEKEEYIGPVAAYTESGIFS